jgi:hypothetical protein
MAHKRPTPDTTPPRARRPRTAVLAVAKGRVGKKRSGQRLQRQANTHLLHHVLLALVVQVHLYGAERPCT